VKVNINLAQEVLDDVTLGGVGVEGYVDLLQHLRDLTGQEWPVPEVFVELYSARYVVVLADRPIWSIDMAQLISQKSKRGSRPWFGLRPDAR
jgi:hypothetical protein